MQWAVLVIVFFGIVFLSARDWFKSPRASTLPDGSKMSELLRFWKIITPILIAIVSASAMRGLFEFADALLRNFT